MNQQTPTPMDLVPQPSAAREEEMEVAVQRVEALAEEPIMEHVEAFEHAHRILQEYLNEAVDG